VLLLWGCAFGVSVVQKLEADGSSESEAVASVMDWGLAGLLEHFAEKRRGKAGTEGRRAAHGAAEEPPEGNEADNALQHILDELDPADDDWVELALAVTAPRRQRPRQPSVCCCARGRVQGERGLGWMCQGARAGGGERLVRGRKRR